MRIGLWLLGGLLVGCGVSAPLGTAADGGAGDGGHAGHDGAPPGPDGGAACPWGDEIARDAGVGLAAVPHASSPTADEQKVFSAMNARRTAQPLTWNGCLADLARSHSVDMMSQGYFGHGAATDPTTFMIGDRVAATGLALTGHADEDLLTGDFKYYLGSDITTVVTDWMTDAHALPILGCAEAGVAISSMPYMDTTIVWVTADFACP